MSIQRGSVPKPVQWDQAAILSAFGRMVSAVSALADTATNPQHDANAVVVREVTAERLIATLEQAIQELGQLNQQLHLITEASFETGEDLDGT